jgi:hypothetical protein
MENLGTRPVTDLEKATVCWKLHHEFSVSESRLLKDFLLTNGLKGNRHQLHRYFRIAQLPEVVQRSIFEHGLQIDCALEITDWRADEWKLFLHLVSEYRLGKNRQKELFTLLDELRLEDNRILTQIWQDCGAKEIDQGAELPADRRLTEILKVLHRLRYPVLTEYEERYRKLKKALRLPPELRIQVPPFFEGEQVTVMFKAANPAEFGRLVQKLARVARQDELAEIFGLL